MTVWPAVDPNEELAQVVDAERLAELRRSLVSALHYFEQTRDARLRMLGLEGVIPPGGCDGVTQKELHVPQLNEGDGSKIVGTGQRGFSHAGLCTCNCHKNTSGA